MGGKNGTIIVSASSHTEVFINKGLGEGPWVKIATPAAKAYTRHLRFFKGQVEIDDYGGWTAPSYYHEECGGAHDCGYQQLVSLG